ncbi:MAG TPA: hypothetical protein VKV16_08585, partial [Solirubrobacteraceae bacterium]|nr:hypothetical protein [Solirubrobacteraceae bacterium]
MRLVAVAVALSAGTLAASACGGAGTSAARSARRKLPESVLVNASKVCGTQLSTGVQTPVVRSFTRAGRYAVGDALFVGHERPLVIRLTAGCSRGARVQLSPAGVVRV